MRLKTTHWAIAAYGWAAVIFVVSVIPAEDLPSVSIWEADKLFHALVYALLTGFAWQYFLKKNPPQHPYQRAVVVTTLCILYGFIIELIQLALPTRSFDMYDALANSIGCFTAFLVVLFIREKPKKA